MKQFIFSIIILLLSTVVFVGCKSSSFRNISTSKMHIEKDVYVVGAGENALGVSVAKLWKNGIEQNLSNGDNNAEANSIYISDNDVYIAGRISNIATLWKNGVVQNLTDGNDWAEANSVYINENDIYVVGKDRNGQIEFMATLWKNGVAEYLTDGNGYGGGAAYSVSVSNNNVYIIGLDNSGSLLWKNEDKEYFNTKAGVGVAKFIRIFDNNMYITGYERNKRGKNVAILWKNYEKQYLTDGGNNASANSVYVYDNDIYVVGCERIDDLGIQVAKLWKNGIAENLKDGCLASDIYVSDNNVYVSGFGFNSQNKAVAIVWINGEPQYLTDGTYHARGYSIFVK